MEIELMETEENLGFKKYPFVTLIKQSSFAYLQLSLQICGYIFKMPLCLIYKIPAYTKPGRLMHVGIKLCNSAHIISKTVKIPRLN